MLTTNHNLIRPNLAYAEETRARVRQKLHTSLNHLVFDVFQKSIAPPISESDLSDLILEGPGFPSAAVFALHGALLDAAIRNDHCEVPAFLQVLGGMVARDTRAPADFSIRCLGEPDLHRDEVFVLKRAYADDAGLTTELVAPPADQAEAAKQLLLEAMTGLDTAAPDWGKELRLHADQVLLTVAAGEGENKFGGASVFDAFGSVLLNPTMINDHPTALMQLVHESSHQQMFLFHLDDPVILNDANETFVSPLRKVPRPMEGIFHAMWVMARMALAADVVMTSPNKPQWAEDLAQPKASALTAFHDCAGIVADHAKLTALGQALFKDAQDAINEL